MERMASTESPVDDWIAWMRPAMSSVALPVWAARSFTSAATTAKPRPASPARAASMVALRARRLVCSEISRIRETTSPIFSAALARPTTLMSVCFASSEAAVTRSLVRCTWWPISAIDEVISVLAAAIICTFSAEWLEASLTERARSDVAVDRSFNEVAD